MKYVSDLIFQKLLSQFEKMSKANQKLREEVDRLNDAMKLAECQHLGCGGNLKPDEIVKSMRGILRDAIARTAFNLGIMSNEHWLGFQGATEEDFDAAKKAFDKAKQVKSAYIEGFTSSKPWRDEEAFWNASRAKKEIEKEVSE